MKGRDRAFTLTELVVVMAILVVLAIILLPVAVTARAEANRSVCLSNLRQAHTAVELYVKDYDEYYPVVNYQPGNPDSTTDRTWVQVLLPYVHSLSIFKCPADYGNRPKIDSSFDEDLVPDDTYQKYYTTSQRTDFGYNFMYLAPIVSENNIWRSVPRSTTDTGDPSKTILFVDSVWTRDSLGHPTGGGNWLVIPPCRFMEKNGTTVDTFRVGQNEVYRGFGQGWSGDPVSRLLYGGAWPWHNGRMNVIRVDGNAASVSPLNLSQGCDLKPDWSGLITTPAKYMWALDAE